jgi:hypothetical protein
VPAAALAQSSPPTPATSPATSPGIPAVAQMPPPIRMSDLLWLALALLVIVGTGRVSVIPGPRTNRASPRWRATW